MSRKLFAFLLSELKTFRIVCKRAECGGISEVTLARMKETFSKVACPLCGKELVPFVPNTLSTPFTRFAEAVEELQRHQLTVDMELTIPDQPTEKPTN